MAAKVPQRLESKRRRDLRNALQPDYAEAFNNLGQALKAQGQVAEAALCFSQALALRP